MEKSLSGRTINLSSLRTSFLFIILVFPFIQPPALKIYVGIDLLYNIWRLVSVLCIFINLIINVKSVSKYILYVFCYRISLLISTIVNNGNIVNWLITTVTILSLLFLIENFLKKDTLIVIQSLNFLFEVYIYINLLSVIIYPEGINNIENFYFLGGTTGAIRIILPGVMFALLNSEIKYGYFSVRTILLCIAVMVTNVLTWTVTSMLGFSIVLLYVLLFRKKLLIKSINIFFGWLSSIIIFYLIVIVRVSDIFENIIVNYFGKSMTFTGRTYLWDNALIAIRESPVIGHGINFDSTLLSVIGNINGSHNYYLDILYRSGLLGLLLFTIIVFSYMKNIKMYEKSKFAQIITIISFSYFIMWIAEPFYNEEYLTFTVFLIGYHIDKVIIYQDKKDRRLE